MTSLLQTQLALHVVFGLGGAIGVYAAWMQMLRLAPSIKFAARMCSAAALAFGLSWLSGGAYYTSYYGTAVKPLIKTGPYPWAHAFVMEAKEHVFIILPFLTLTAAVALYVLDEKAGEPAMKRRLSGLLGIVTVLAIFMALAGMVISGAVRK